MARAVVRPDSALDKPAHRIFKGVRGRFSFRFRNSARHVAGRARGLISGPPQV